MKLMWFDPVCLDFLKFSRFSWNLILIFIFLPVPSALPSAGHVHVLQKSTWRTVGRHARSHLQLPIRSVPERFGSYSQYWSVLHFSSIFTVFRIFQAKEWFLSARRTRISCSPTRWETRIILDTSVSFYQLINVSSEILQRNSSRISWL